MHGPLDHIPPKDGYVYILPDTVHACVSERAMGILLINGRKSKQGSPEAKRLHVRAVIKHCRWGVNNLKHPYDLREAVTAAVLERNEYYEEDQNMGSRAYAILDHNMAK